MRGLRRPNREGTERVMAKIAAPALATRVRKALGERAKSDWCEHEPRSARAPLTAIERQHAKCQALVRYRVTVGRGKLAIVRDLCQTHALRTIGNASSEGTAYVLAYAPGCEPSPRASVPAPAPAPSLLPAPPAPSSAGRRPEGSRRQKGRQKGAQTP